MDTDFDRYKDTYRQEVESATSFVGQTPDFFTEVKAEHLLGVWRDHFGSSSGLTVLDLGCGIGQTDRLLIPHVGELHGVDVAPETIARAREANPRGRYESYDGSSLPYEDSAFDATFAICVLHHVEPAERAALVAELARVTRAGGLTTIYEHNPYHPLTRLAVSRCEFDEDAILLSRRETRSLLESQGLPVIVAPYILFVPLRGRLFRSVERALGWLPAGAQFCVVGQKDE